jgi:hypothetical protein
VLSEPAARPTITLRPAAGRDLTRQKNAVTSQLGQMLSGLAGIVPTPGEGKGDGQGAR